MKLLFKVLLPIFTCILLASCGKDEKEPDTTIDPLGFWSGVYGRSTEPQTIYYAMLFRSNGTVRIYSANADTTIANKAEGTYSVSGNEVTTNYTYISGGISGTFSTKAAFSNSNTRQIGTYGADANVSGGGTYTINKE
jgi:hypothetical protein